MRPRGCGCFSTLIILVLLLVICAGLGWFVGVPRIRDSVSDSIEHGIGTEVSQQFANVSVPAGNYTLNLDTIAAQMHGQLDDAGVESITLRGDGASGRIYLGLTSRGSEAIYSGNPTVIDGKLVMTDMTTSNNVLGFLIPPDRLGNAIETGVNTFFAQQGLRITGIEVGVDTLTVYTAPVS
ncbi:MAG: hypothetical protein QM589_15845 [Thermomicrobiales bacterium]